MHLKNEFSPFQTEEEMENRERVRREAAQAETDRFNAIKCPACKSNEKSRYTQRGDNGVFGPGFNSWIIEEYLICQSCGIHYSDLNKPK